MFDRFADQAVCLTPPTAVVAAGRPTVPTSRTCAGSAERREACLASARTVVDRSGCAKQVNSIHIASRPLNSKNPEISGRNRKGCALSSSRTWARHRAVAWNKHGMTGAEFALVDFVPDGLRAEGYGSASSRSLTGLSTSFRPLHISLQTTSLS
jgi:hypothetical protein